MVGCLSGGGKGWGRLSVFSLLVPFVPSIYFIEIV